MQMLNHLLQCRETMRKLDVKVAEVFLVVVWQCPNPVKNCSVHSRLACQTLCGLSQQSWPQFVREGESCRII